MDDPLTRKKTGLRAWGKALPLQVWLSILVLLVLVPTLAVGSLTLLKAGQSYRDASSNALLQTAQLVGQSVSNELQATGRIIERYGPSERADEVADGTPFDGQVRSSIVPNGVDVDRTDPIKVLAHEAARKNATVVSNIFLAKEQGDDPLIAIAVPRHKTANGVEVATLVAKPIDLVRTLIREDAFVRTQLIAVTDGDGRVIARSREAAKLIGTRVPDWSALIALNQPNGTLEARTVEGPKVMFAFHQIAGTPGWVAVVGEPLSVFDARWRRPIDVMLIASALTLVFALILAMLLGRKILQPIKRLAHNAALTAAGERSADVDFQTRSFVTEFEALRRSLEKADTATHRSHQAVSKSYQELRQAEKLARIGSWTLDLETRDFTCSDMLYELNGADPNGPRLNIDSLGKLIAPQSLETMVAALNHCAETGKPYGMEVRHQRPDGTTFPAIVRGEAVRNEDGKIVCVTGTVQDISERIEVRERLATLADNLPSGVIYRLEEASQEDRTLIVSYVSGGIQPLIGVNGGEITHNRTAFTRRIVRADRVPFAKALIRSRITGDPVDQTIRVGTRDGRVLWMQMRCAPRKQPDGTTVWDGIARDVTSERQAADALREAKEAAEVAERAKSEFLATMSHEIRTPMNTVIGMTRLTLQTPLAPKQRNYLEKIDLSAKTLLGVINDILDFSKIEAGGLEFEDTQFTVESLLDSVSAVLAMSAEEKGLEMIYAVGARVPTAIHGDPLRIGQVLTNLVSNAVKFTQDGEVFIAINSIEDANGDPFLHFTVRDTGIGLSPDQISGLFRPFTQGGNDTFRKYGGTGLGLAISKQLVDLMGGRIWAEGVPNEGCTFHFTIPNRPVEVGALSRPSRRGNGQLNDRRVLIVDDNASARHILGDMLRDFGLEVVEAHSGAAALARLKAEVARGTPFDIVLMDWRMPEMDGLETARRIRSDETLFYMPAVLMVTAYGREEVLKGVEKLCLEGLLIKPVTASVLFNTVVDILSPRTEQILQRAPQSASAREAYSALHGKRILVVDDNALNREVASDFLAIIGVEVETANDGIEALAAIDAKHFDAVLMDVHMPNMDGLTATREIRKDARRATLPVIALTALARVEDQKKSREAGMSAHLTKPIEDAALYRTLAEVLDVDHDRRSLKKGNESAAHGLDLPMALRRFGNNQARLERMLVSFLNESANAPNLFAAHMQLGDDEAAGALAHRLKGSSSYFGAKRFCGIAETIERAVYEGASAAPYENDFISALNELLDEGREALAKMRQDKEAAGAGVDRQAILALITRTASLIEHGDYTASLLLEEIRNALQGAEAALAGTAQAQFDDLDVVAAAASLQQLRDMVATESTPS